MDRYEQLARLGAWGTDSRSTPADKQLALLGACLAESRLPSPVYDGPTSIIETEEPVLSTDSETEEEAHRRRSGGRGSAGGDPKVDKKITEIVKQMEAKGQSGSIYVSDEGQHLKSQNSKAIISFVFNAS